MPDEKYAEVEEMESIVKLVQQTGETMKEAAAYAVEADPDMYMWGAVGAPFAFVYFQATPHIHDILHRMPDAIGGVARRIAEAAESITDCDEEAKGAFDDLHGALEGKA